MVLVPDASGSRAAKLIRSFWAVTKGEQQITNVHYAKLFLQACKAYSDRNSAVKCVEVLISNPAGIAAVDRAVRVDLSPSFINSTTLPFILILSDPGVIALNNGGFLRQLLSAILEPATFWNVSMDAYLNDKLDAGLEAFAWLCLQIVSDRTSFDAQKVAVEEVMERKSLVASQSPELRKIAYRIENVIKIFSQPEAVTDGVKPGGRHDNDHSDFRQISIYPSPDELLSTDPPYLQRLADVFDTPLDTRSQSYRDWLFRLLREDMLSELREDLQVATGQKKSNRRPVALGQLRLVGINRDNDLDTRTMPPYTLYATCNEGVNFPRKLPKGGKKAFITDSKNFIKHDSFGALCLDGSVIAFGSLVRDVDNLLKTPPVVGFRFTDDSGLKHALTVLQSPYKDQVRFLIVDTATFAYEPILKRLKTIGELSLEPQLINPEQPSQDGPRSTKLDPFLMQMKSAFQAGLRVKMPTSLKLDKDIYLQDAQLNSFIHGLSRDLALIQGPPGTGKSFLGALILLTILRLTTSRVLVLSYTNHALDQFLEDLMDIGVSADQMVRLGSKCTEATKPTLLREYDGQKKFWLTMEERNILNALRVEENALNMELQECSRKLAGWDVRPADILEYLEFSDAFTSAWAAFQVPYDDGFQMADSHGKAAESDTIYQYWLDGRDVDQMGSLGTTLDPSALSVWRIPSESRNQLHGVWSQTVREEQILNFADLSKKYNDIKTKVKSILDERGRRVLKDKRIIGSTTTAAAMYQSIIETANPDVILVEEAGEILEAHIITAMSASVKQLILIGDHKQLRPKVNNYKLTKEKGEGFDLNVSLFERLVGQGRDFTALEEQHRSHPDISQYPRMLANAPLSCEKHICHRRCHRVQDHSKIPCFEKVDHVCNRGHKSKITCGDKSKTCKPCIKEDEDTRRRIERDLELEKKRQEQQEKYRLELQEIDDEIDHRKTTVARIYAEFLSSVGAIPGKSFEEVSGSKLANMGVTGCEKLLDTVNEKGGGCVFIDEAYQLSSGNSSGGKAVLDYLLAEVENRRGKIVFVLAGYSTEMESFFAHNPGIPSRFPTELKFEDYTDEELLQILQLQIHRKFRGRMAVEQGVDGLFCRIVSRRIGYGRGKNGFGNARAVENYLQNITNRQATRIRRERRAGNKSNDLLLTQEDIIGPEPSQALTKSKAYRELNCLIGLQEVKEALKVLMDTLKTNYERELAEQPIVEFSLNKVFLGSPGTGKTTIAKFYGEILKDLGLLSNGEVIVKNPADFVGPHIGSSEAQTKGILASTVGKVLVIDEAYGLLGGKSDGSGLNQFKAAVIDTIVAEVQSVPGEDRCVLLLGYTEQMEDLFQNANPGLSRRFPMSSAFVFEDFDEAALAKILDLKLGKSGFKATEKAKAVALEVLRRARNRPNFGNAGEIDILLGRAMASHQKRVSSGKVKRHGTLEAVDMDEEFDRAEKDTDVKKLFAGDIGRDSLISILKGYQDRVRQARALKIDPEIPYNFLFRGPPGTGKTTAARKMGKVYYDMGLLGSTEVIEVSATELIGQYVGHTGPKVQKLLERSMGRVLFIDEAYRLAGNERGGSFAREAVDDTLDDMMRERRGRMRNKKPTVSTKGAQPPVNMPVFTPPANPTSTATAAKGDTKEVPAEESVSPSDTRDAGVSDEVWDQLQKDRKKEAEDNEELRQLKKAQQSAKDAARERILREILAKEEERKKNEAKKKKLMTLGICPMGFQWIKQSGGYRCAGGSHWMSDDMSDCVQGSENKAAGFFRIEKGELCVYNYEYVGVKFFIEGERTMKDETVQEVVAKSGDVVGCNKGSTATVSTESVTRAFFSG
ncbi:P-loop containing nucleoside triphosphate hydrolase protein [Fusarium acuminatum]|uniref:P-loop containing nucleoside triphosphate hydrolase protein n=1 Tax=Fusarium acuminatum TaxID=5515 RepID=A0ABZ2X5B5_9HYPO